MTGQLLTRRGTAVALIAGFLLMVSGAPLAAAKDLPASLDSVEIANGAVGGVLTASALPDGVGIDPSTITVHIADQQVRASAEPAASSARTVVLLVDISGSMKGAGIQAAKSAAATFLDVVPADVHVSLVAFNDHAEVLVAPTLDRAMVGDAIASLEPTRETALYDAIPVALEVLPPSGNRTVVLLSDGGDTVSLGTRETAVHAVADSDVRAEVIGFRTDETQDQVLADLAVAGRGRVAQVEDAAALSAAFTRIAQTLTHQLVITAEFPPGVDGEAEVRVAAAAGADRVTATATVILPKASAAESQDVAPAAGASSGTMVAAVPAWLENPWPIALAVGLFVLLVALLVASPLFEPKRRRRTREIEFYAMQGRRTGVQGALRSASPNQAAQPFLNAAESFVERRGLHEKWALRLDRADMAVRPHEWLVLRLAAVLVAISLMAVIGAGWLLSLVSGVLTWAVSGLYVRVKAARRLARFSTQLPDALNLVASSLKTGFSLAQALDAVARDTAEPMRGEIGRALAETRLGAEIEEALERTAQRMDSEDLRWTVMAMQVQRQVGGNLAETLRTTVATLRERSMLRRQVKALSAEGRLSGYILIGLPVGITVWLYISNGQYISLLWSSLLGWIMITVAVVGMIIGTLWMRKVVKVEV